MVKFYGTIEFLSGQKAAILTLTNQAGEWAGSGRIEVSSGLESDLYEEAYRQASLNAWAKGGRLERFSVVGPEPPTPPRRPTFREHRMSCRSRVESPIERRPANALNLEFIQTSDRCLNQPPSHWPEGHWALRWIGSGGSPLVFGECSAQSCPERG